MWGSEHEEVQTFPSKDEAVEEKEHGLSKQGWQRPRVVRLQREHYLRNSLGQGCPKKDNRREDEGSSSKRVDNCPEWWSQEAKMFLEVNSDSSIWRRSFQTKGIQILVDKSSR